MTDELGYMGKYLREYVPVSNVNTFIHSFYQEIRAFPETAVIVQQKQIPDVSFYDGLIDWDAMKAHTDSVIIRAGQGNWIDEYFFTNWAEAKARGMLRALYWFYDGRFSPGNQAALLASLFETDPPELFIATDWEKNYNGSFEGLPQVIAFMQRLGVLLPGVRQSFYTGYYYFIANSNPTTNSSQYSYLKSIPLWLAWYTNTPAVVLIPKPWIDLEFWQWGTPGWGEAWGSAKQEIDMSYYNGTTQAFYDLYGTPSGETGDQMTRYFKIAGTPVIPPVLVMNIRAGTSTAAADLGDLFAGDLVEVSETVTVSATDHWGKLAKITRANGTVFPLPAATCYVSLNTTNTLEYFPVPAVQPKIEVVLAKGSVVTVTKADGTQEVITA